MSVGTALDADLATTTALTAYVELYRAAVFGGDTEAIRRARISCEAALEARCDAIDALVKAQRDHRRKLGL